MRELNSSCVGKLWPEGVAAAGDVEDLSVLLAGKFRMSLFFSLSSLENESTRHRDFPHHAEARFAIAEYIEVFYNRQRLHQALGYRSPEEFEQQESEA